MDEYLGQLVRYSLLERIGTANAVSMHRLVQTVIRERLSINEQEACLTQVIDNSLLSYPNETNVQLDFYKRLLIPHFESILGHLSTFPKSQEIFLHKKIKLLDTIGLAYLELIREPNHAVEILEEKLTIEKEIYEKDHFEMSKTLGSLANAHGDLGNAKKQKQLLKYVLVSFEKKATQPVVAVALVNLANAYGALGKPIKQKIHLERALSIYENYYNANHPEVAIVLVNLANAYGALGNHLEQKELLERALKIKEPYFGVNHPEVAIVLVNLACAHGDLGKPEKQKELLERALAIQEPYYGFNHFEVARTLANLATAYGDLGNANQMKLLSERALKIFKNHYGLSHPEVASTLAILAIAYGDLGDHKKKKELLDRALHIFENCYGSNHPEVARTLGNLASAYQTLGNAIKQIELLERALNIKEYYFGVNHPETASTMINLASAYSQLNNFQKATQLASKAYAIVEGYPGYGPTHPLAIQIKKMQQCFMKDQLKSLESSFAEFPLASYLIKQVTSRLSNQLYSGFITNTEHMFERIFSKSKDIASLDKNISKKYNLPNISQLSLEKGLRQAAYNNQISDLKTFIEHVSNINAQDNNPASKKTALHYAVIKKYIECIKLLMDAGADIYLKDAKGNDSLVYAKDHEEIRRILQNYNRNQLLN